MSCNYLDNLVCYGCNFCEYGKIHAYLSCSNNKIDNSGMCAKHIGHSIANDVFLDLKNNENNIILTSYNLDNIKRYYNHALINNGIFNITDNISNNIADNNDYYFYKSRNANCLAIFCAIVRHFLELVQNTTMPINKTPFAIKLYKYISYHPKCMHHTKNFYNVCKDKLSELITECKNNPNIMHYVIEFELLNIELFSE